MNFALDRLFEVLIFLLLLPRGVRLDPALPDRAETVFLVPRESLLDHALRVFAPLRVLLELKEAAELNRAKARHSLTLVGPEGKELTADIQALSQLLFLRQILAQALKLALLESKHGVAAAPFSIDGLGLLGAEALLGAEELLHRLGAEPDEELVELALEKVNVLLVLFRRVQIGGERHSKLVEVGLLVQGGPR